MGYDSHQKFKQKKCRGPALTASLGKIDISSAKPILGSAK